jgi:hypothetical protein
MTPMTRLDADRWQSRVIATLTVGSEHARRLDCVWGHRRAVPYRGFKSPPVRRPFMPPIARYGRLDGPDLPLDRVGARSGWCSWPLSDHRGMGNRVVGEQSDEFVKQRLAGARRPGR